MRRSQKPGPQRNKGPAKTDTRWADSLRGSQGQSISFRAGWCNRSGSRYNHTFGTKSTLGKHRDRAAMPKCTNEVVSQAVPGSCLAGRRFWPPSFSAPGSKPPPTNPRHRSRRAAPLGVSARRSAGATAVQQGDLVETPVDAFVLNQLEETAADLFGPGRPSRTHSPGEIRSAGSAADRRRSRAVRRRQASRRLRATDRRFPRQPALWRELGAECGSTSCGLPTPPASMPTPTGRWRTSIATTSSARSTTTSRTTASCRSNWPATNSFPTASRR